MKTRYFQVQDYRHIVTTPKYTYKFEKSHRNMLTGGAYGLLALENEEEANELSRVAKNFGVLELSEDEAIKTLQKKSSLNINTMKGRVENSPKNVGHVEAKSDGEISSVEDIDELITNLESELPKTEEEKPEIPKIEEEKPELPKIEEEKLEKPISRKGRPPKKHQ